MKKLFLPLALLFFFVAHFVWYSLKTYRFTAKLLLLPALYFAFMHYAEKKEGRTFVVLRRLATTLLLLGITVTIILCGAIFTEVGGDKDHQCDYVIILGAGIEDDKPSRTLTDRLDKAVDYLNKHPESTAIVSGGQGDDEIVTEASVMKNYLISHGIDKSRIIEEDQADNTNENMKFSFEIIKSRGGGSVAVISSDYHIFRARRLAENTSLSPIMLSAKTSSPTLFANCILREAFALIKAYAVFI